MAKRWVMKKPPKKPVRRTEREYLHIYGSSLEEVVRELSIRKIDFSKAYFDDESIHFPVIESETIFNNRMDNYKTKMKEYKEWVSLNKEKIEEVLNKRKAEEIKKTEADIIKAKKLIEELEKKLKE